METQSAKQEVTDPPMAAWPTHHFAIVRTVSRKKEIRKRLLYEVELQ